MRSAFPIVFSSLIFVAGCLDGDMNAVSSRGIPVKFRYSQGISSDTYFAEIGREKFEGRAVMVDASTTFGTAFGTVYTNSGSAMNAANYVGYTTTGKFKAVMIGDRGSVLRCLMQYADSSGYTTPGGVGECKHSDGSRLDVVW